MSPIDAPPVARAGEPTKPARKRKARRVAMLGAKMTGICEGCERGFREGKRGTHLEDHKEEETDDIHGVTTD